MCAAGHGVPEHTAEEAQESKRNECHLRGIYNSRCIEYGYQVDEPKNEWNKMRVYVYCVIVSARPLTSPRQEKKTPTSFVMYSKQ